MGSNTASFICPHQPGSPSKLLDDYVKVMGRVCKQARALREFEI